MHAFKEPSNIGTTEEVNVSPRSRNPSRAIGSFFLWCLALFCALLFLAVLFWSKTRVYVQAAAVLDQLNGQPVPRLMRPIAAMPLTTRTVTIPSAAGPVRARLYAPVQRPDAPGLVLVPGITYLGMNEPRLMAFARSLAACGLRVLTPELPDSRDYRIDPGDITALGDAAQWLAHATGRRVGLMGLSFSGSLALLAAAEPSYARQISFVFAVGAYDNLFRVATFYVTNADPLPDGNIERDTPNNYGPWILEYEHLEDFTDPADTAPIRAVLRARLYNDPALEKQLATELTPRQKKEYAGILAHADQPLFRSDKKHAAEMAAVSPHGHLAGLHVPVYLLHGREDNIIPFAESEWLAQDLPPGSLQEMLISPLVGHVGTTRVKSSVAGKWRLLHLLAQVMERAEHG